jgi:ligand-binding sensor domain-containing protein/signal transduction histidine kinase
MSPLAYKQSRPFSFSRWCAFLFVAVVLHCSALGAPTQSSGSSRLNAPLTFPMEEGEGIRFSKLPSTAELSQTRVSNILQDDQGFIWFGTQDGLNRFDGYTCRVFRHNPQRPDSLGGAYIHALFEDRSGFLWVGSDQSLDRFDPATESFIHYPLTTSDGRSFSAIVTDISEDKFGFLWLSTNSGLFRLDPATGHSTRYVHDPGDPTSITDDDVKSTGQDREGRFWVATSRSLDQLNLTTGKVIRRIDLPYSGVGVYFHEDRFGNFWIVYGDDGLPAILDRDSGTLTRYRFSPYSRLDRLSSRVYTMVEDHDGNMWFGTAENGVVEFDRHRRVFVSYSNHVGNTDSLSDNRVSALFVDRDGTIWVGLHQAGPNFFTTKPPSFESIRYSPGNPHSLPAPLVSALYIDHDDVLWVATDRGVALINRKTNKYSTFNRIQRTGATVLSVIEEGFNMVWFGTGHGIVRYDRHTGEMKGYLNEKEFATSNCQQSIVERLLFDRQGTLWAATWDGLCRYDASTKEFRTFKPDDHSRGLHYNAIALDNDGKVWLGGDIGLDRFDPSTTRFTIYRHNNDDPRSLSGNRVNSVFFDHRGTMWVGTQTGLGKFDPATKTFTTYGEDQGMSGNVVSCILEDKHGTLWMSTNKGLANFDPQAITFKNYTTADGLPGPDLTGWGACAQSADGEMFFGGFSGLTAFFPDRIEPDYHVPRVELTDFQLFGQSVRLGKQSILKQSITHTNQITLSHGQDVFSIEFSALSYLDAASTRYRYKLDGLDTRWNEVDSQHRLAAYTTLPHGTYTFRVEAATPHGQWSELGATLRISVLPPWWETLWFRLVCILCALIAMRVLYLRHMVRITAEIRTRMEERLRERERIARDLHDTFLQGTQGLLMRLNTAVRSLPPEAPSRTALEGTLEQFYEVMTAGRQVVENLRQSSKTMKLIDEFELAGREFQGLYPTSFAVHSDANQLLLSPFVAEELLKIGREAISNAFRHANAMKIEVKVEFGTSNLKLTVQDNGKGIDDSILIDGKKSGHWGLPGMKERVAQLGGMIRFEAKPGFGTTVEVRIPAKTAYQSKRSRLLAWFRTTSKRDDS